MTDPDESPVFYSREMSEEGAQRMQNDATRQIRQVLKGDSDFVLLPVSEYGADQNATALFPKQVVAENIAEMSVSKIADIEFNH